MTATEFGELRLSLLLCQIMFGIEALMAFVQQVSGTPYITGGDSSAGTDCSGLASWVTNVATGRPAFGSRFNTGNEESALLARGFRYGTAPNALVVGWNSHHTAVTLPDGTPVASGEPGGVKVGGGGAYQRQFTRHMFLPLEEAAPGEESPMDAPPAFGGFPPPEAEPMLMPAPFEAPFGAPPADGPPIEEPAIESGPAPLERDGQPV